MVIRLGCPFHFFSSLNRNLDYGVSETAFAHHGKGISYHDFAAGGRIERELDA
jgi:hypothetical protein